VKSIQIQNHIPMKKSRFYCFGLILLTAVSFTLSSCCDEKAAPSACIEDKITAFESESSAYAIYEIDAPGGKLYLFQHSTPDAGDLVYDSECQEVCITNVEGYDIGMIPCEQEVYNAPRSKIWQK
jgi:hypothetical protein